MDVDSYYYRIDSRNFVGSKVDQDQNTIVLSCLPGTISEIPDYLRCERNGIIRSSHDEEKIQTKYYLRDVIHLLCFTLHALRSIIICEVTELRTQTIHSSKRHHHKFITTVVQTVVHTENYHVKGIPVGAARTIEIIILNIRF